MKIGRELDFASLIECENMNNIIKSFIVLLTLCVSLSCSNAILDESETRGNRSDSNVFLPAYDWGHQPESDVEVMLHLSKDTLELTKDVILVNREIQLNDILYNKELAGKRLEFWALEGRPKNIEENWYDWYKYNEVGKLIAFGYSSCLFCGSGASWYEINYNDAGNMTQIVQTMNWREKIVIAYDDYEKVKAVFFYEFDKLVKRVVLTGI